MTVCVTQNCTVKEALGSLSWLVLIHCFILLTHLARTQSPRTSRKPLAARRYGIDRRLTTLRPSHWVLYRASSSWCASGISFLLRKSTLAWMTGSSFSRFSAEYLARWLSLMVLCRTDWEKMSGPYRPQRSPTLDGFFTLWLYYISHRSCCWNCHCCSSTCASSPKREFDAYYWRLQPSIPSLEYYSSSWLSSSAVQSATSGQNGTANILALVSILMR